MGRFLAIVAALVAVALLINYFQSKEKPVTEQEPALIAPETIEAPAEKPAEVAEEVVIAAPVADEAATPRSTEEGPTETLPQPERSPLPK